MAYTLNRFENMIKEFIIDEQSDAHNSRNINYQRYNNLKVFMTPAKQKTPHIWVRVGISEGCFSIESASLLEGSLGQDVKYIVKWINKSGIRDELTASWNEALVVDYNDIKK